MDLEHFYKIELASLTAKQARIALATRAILIEREMSLKRKKKVLKPPYIYEYINIFKVT